MRAVVLTLALLLTCIPMIHAAPRPPVALLPDGSAPAFVEVDLRALRAAGPPSTVSAVHEALRARLAARGIDVDKLEQLAAALVSERRGVVLFDAAALPDPGRLLGDLSPLRSHRGVAISATPGGARGMAQLPGGPLALASPPTVLPAVIDLFQGQRGARPLLRGEPEALLKRAGRAPGTIVSLFARPPQAALREAGLPPTSVVVAAVLAPPAEGTPGALRAIARCREGAAAAESLATALRAQRDELAARPELLLLGLANLLRSTEVSASGEDVAITLPLPRAEWSGLLLRAVGLVETMLPPPPRPAPSPAAPQPSR